MKFKWFADDKITDINMLRAAYKRLLVEYHPDNNKEWDTTYIMQEINGEYAELFKRFRNKFEHSNNAKEEFSLQQYDWQKDENIRRMIWKLCSLDGINIEICGIWIWVSGNTAKYKKELKEWGMRWAKNKQMWYIHYDDTYQHRHHKTLSMEEIRENYGSENVSKSHFRKKKLQQA